MNPYRGLILLLAYSAVTAFAADAPAANPAGPVSSVVNQGLPSWLRFGGEERSRMENLTGEGFKSVGDLYLLNRLRLDMEVRPRAWFTFHFEAQDARVFGQNTLPAPASQKDPMSLRVGYVQVGTEEGPLMLRAGRQPLTFGEGRVLTDAVWSNVGRTFDSARLTVHHGGLKVDFFSGAAVKMDTPCFDEPTPGEHFDGAYGSWQGLVPNATLEPYVLWRMEQGYKAASGKIGSLSEKALGFRWVGKLPLRFDYGAEVTDEVGSSAGSQVRAWAGHATVGYTLPNQRYLPRFFTEVNRASGHANAKDGLQGDYDPLFGGAHDKYGLTDLLTWTNLEHWRTGFGWTVRRGVTAAVAYNSFWLANPDDSLYVGGKSVARSANGAAGRYIGQEPDVQAFWALSRSTQINVGYGRLFPGEFLVRTTAHVPYSIVFCNVAQRF